MTLHPLLVSCMVVLGLAAAGLPGPAHAVDAGTCYTLGDADARVLCLARARRDPGMCHAVQRADLRAQCLAEIRS